MSANTQVVETAAPKGVGLAELEEAVLLQAEVMDLKASRSGRVEATVVEARRDKGQGPIATVIVKRGRLQVRICTHSVQGEDFTVEGECVRVSSIYRQPAGPHLHLPAALATSCVGAGFLRVARTAVAQGSEVTLIILQS